MKKLKGVLKGLWNACCIGVACACVLFLVIRIVMWILEPFSSVTVALVFAVFFVIGILSQSKK